MENALIKHPAVNTTMGCIRYRGKHSKKDCDKWETEISDKCPQYTHEFLWDTHDISDHGGFSDMACWGLTALLVPGVPLKEFGNLEALRTIETNPGLFQVNCNLNIDHSQELLVNHPNQTLFPRFQRNGGWRKDQSCSQSRT